MINRNQCDTSNPCEIMGVGTNGCLTNLTSVGIGDHMLLPQASDDFKKMVNDMPSNIKTSLKLSDSYRPLKVQCNILDWNHFNNTKKKRKKGTTSTPVAYPGTSNHGWGRAIDISPKEVQDWVRNNGEKYKWCWGEVKSEPWHFTYCGGGPHRYSGCDKICKNVNVKDSDSTQISKKVKYGLKQNAYEGEASSNINMIISKLNNYGITNPITQLGILSVIGKESGFIPQSEKGYGSTSNDRIRKIFSSTRKLNDKQLDKLKSNDEQFFNYVYGPKGAGPGLGNTQSDDGYKFIGRGFNQITGRNNYKKYGVENNPESLNDPDKAADVMINFLAKEGESLNNKFNSVDESIEFFVTRNAGGRKSPSEEEKAKKVASNFKISSIGEYDEEDVEDDFYNDDENYKNNNNVKTPFDPLIKLLSPFVTENKIKEDVDRISLLIKKVL
jgi:predicted chitinase